MRSYLLSGLTVPSKEFLSSALAVLTGLWHLNPAQQLEQVTRNLFACLQGASMLPTLPLQALISKDIAHRDIASLLHSLWTYLLDNDKSKITAKLNLLIMENPKLCVLSIFEQM